MKNNFHEYTVGMVFHPPSFAAMQDHIRSNHTIINFFYERLSSYLRKRLLTVLPSSRFFYIKGIHSTELVRVNFVGFLLPLLPDQLVTMDKGDLRRKILALISKARRLNVKLLTLGAFTSILTNQGKDLVSDSKIPLTSGNTYTAALCVQSITKLCTILGKDLKGSTMTIIGATGDIGSIISKVFVNKVRKIILCSRSITSEHSLCKELNLLSKSVVISRDPQMILDESDITICATSAMNILIDSKRLKSGSIVCDVSVPANVAASIIKERPDVMVFEGGRARLPEYENILDKRWKSLFPVNSIYGCLMESVILALESRFESYSIGRHTISSEKIEEIYNLGRQWGIDLADFSCNGYIYTMEDFNRLRMVKNAK